MAAPSPKAQKALTDALGANPPKEFKELSSAETETLARLLTESIELHEASIAAAEDNVVKLAPRPLRGTVRKMLGA